MEELGRRETERREQYLNRLERNLEQAKIYPKWAVITFMVFFGISLCAGFYTYLVKSNLSVEKEAAYQRGVDDYSSYMDSFFIENPDSQRKYQLWLQKNSIFVSSIPPGPLNDVHFWGVFCFYTYA